MIYLSLHHNILLFVLHKNLNVSICLAIKSIFKRKMEVIVDFFFYISAWRLLQSNERLWDYSIKEIFVFTCIAFCDKYASYKSLHRENIKKSPRRHSQTISFNYYDYTRHFNLLSRLENSLYFPVLFNYNNVKIK